MAKKPAATKRAPSETRHGRIELMFEQIRDQQQLMMEHIQGLEARLPKGLDDRLGRIELRLDVIEGVLMEHSRILAEHSRILAEHSRFLAQHSQALAELQVEVRAIRADHQQHLSWTEAEVRRIDHRVTDLEARVEALRGKQDG